MKLIVALALISVGFLLGYHCDSVFKLLSSLLLVAVGGAIMESWAGYGDDVELQSPRRVIKQLPRKRHE